MSGRSFPSPRYGQWLAYKIRKLKKQIARRQKELRKLEGRLRPGARR